jgi:endonuclease/exonuclease/phosphatase family metal-dependent hydrolase
MLLKVLCYNIAAGLRKPSVQENLARVAAMISSESPHLVALQEVDRGARRSDRIDEPAWLARETGMDYRFGRSIHHDGGEFGNVILSKLPIKNVLYVSLPGDEARSAMGIEVELPGLPGSGHRLAFVCTHLDWPSEVHQARSIEIIKESFPGLHQILAGDMNAVPGSAVLEKLNPEYISLTSGVGVTFPSDGCQYDHIFYRNRADLPYKLKVSKTLSDPEGISDHLPVMVEISIGE